MRAEAFSCERTLAMNPADADNSSFIVDRMASLLAHDLCNSLSAIKINLQLLERSPERLPHDAERCRIGLSQIAEIESLIADLQTFSRPSRLYPGQFSPDRLLASASQRIAAMANSAGVPVRIEPLDSLPMLRGDQGKLELTLVHLLRNAVEASSAGQSIQLSARHAMENDCLVVTVRDSGSGMSAETLASARTPFFSTRPKGRGLGLAIAERVALAHGGRLALDSVPGKGCSARLYLPLSGA